MEISSTREEPFPEDPEGRMGAALNVVNTELKTATVLHLDDVPREGREIKDRIRESVGQDCKLVQAATFGEYCFHTLVPIGAVAEGVVVREDDESTFLGYRLTEAGRRYCLPIAAFTLEYAVKTGRSMFEILGSTASKGKTRAPLNRIGTLESLGKGTQREADLASNIGLQRNAVLYNLRALKKVGFVRFDSIEESTMGYSVYSWAEGRAPEEAHPVFRHPTLTKKVAEELSKTGEADCHRIANALEHRNPGTISGILAGLEKQGLVKSVKWNGKDRSEVELLDAGRQFLEEYVAPVRDALAGGRALEEMQKGYETLVGDSCLFGEYLRKGIALYRAVSPGINAIWGEGRTYQIISFVRSHPGCRPKDILTHTGARATYLTSLVNAGILWKEKDGRKAIYSLAE